MEELFPSMLQSLSTASERIDNYLANCFNGIPGALTEEQKDEYVEAMSYLRSGLMQLNGYVRIEYKFDQGLIGDIEDYSKLLQEYKPQLEEYVGYQLERGNAFPDDPFAKSQSQFLEEIINRIQVQSNTLNRLLVSV